MWTEYTNPHFVSYGPILIFYVYLRPIFSICFNRHYYWNVRVTWKISLFLLFIISRRFGLLACRDVLANHLSKTIISCVLSYNDAVFCIVTMKYLFLSYLVPEAVWEHTKFVEITIMGKRSSQPSSLHVTHFRWSCAFSRIPFLSMLGKPQRLCNVPSVSVRRTHATNCDQ